MKTKTEVLSDAVERLVGDGLSTHAEVMTHTLDELGRVYESGYVAGYAARQFGDLVRADENNKTGNPARTYGGLSKSTRAQLGRPRR